MKKITVFGAAGGTGSEVVKQALARGHRVTAFIRDPASFEITHPNLTIVKGDVLYPQALNEAIENNDIVVSALGNRSTKPTQLWSRGLHNIISKMEVRNKSRLICISAGGLDINPLNNWFIRFLTKNILQKILKEPYSDLRKMEAEVKNSNLDYTIIRPPRLTDKPGTGKYRFEINAHLENTSSLARADVAHFIVNHLEDRKTYQTTVNLSY